MDESWNNFEIIFYFTCNHGIMHTLTNLAADVTQLVCNRRDTNVTKQYTDWQCRPNTAVTSSSIIIFYFVYSGCNKT